MKDYLVKKEKKKKKRKEKNAKKKIDILVVSEFRIGEQMFSFTKIYKNLMDEKTPVGKNP